MPARQPREGLILFCLWLLLFVTASQFLVMVPILSDIGRALDIPENLQGKNGLALLALRLTVVAD